MIDSEKLEMLKAITGETEDIVLSTYLKVAESKVLRAAYPFDASKTEVPPQYEVVQVQIAAYLINKRGAEGETSHSENGISRSYEDGDIPPTLLREIVPFASTLDNSSGDMA